MLRIFNSLNTKCLAILEAAIHQVVHTAGTLPLEPVTLQQLAILQPEALATLLQEVLVIHLQTHQDLGTLPKEIPDSHNQATHHKAGLDIHHKGDLGILNKEFHLKGDLDIHHNQGIIHMRELDTPEALPPVTLHNQAQAILLKEEHQGTHSTHNKAATHHKPEELPLATHLSNLVVVTRDLSTNRGTPWEAQLVWVLADE